MKTILKHSNYFAFALALCVMTLSGCSCSAPKQQPDPLAGWKILLSRDYEPFDKSITQDYHNYIDNLPNGEKKFVGPLQFFEDGTGQHAVRIEIALNGTDWAHVLFYDKENKRIKVIKYVSGHYRS